MARRNVPGAPYPQIPPPKVDLWALVARLRADDPSAVGPCVDFVCTETRGYWHNRGRAAMCRRLKHASLAREDADRLVTAILARLREGAIPEQFRDQLRLAIVLDPEGARAAAREAATDDREYVRRFAAWVLLSGDA